MITRYEKHAEILKSLAHPVRLAIVFGLSKFDGCNVNKMVDNLEVSQPMVSQHLNILKNAGIVKGYRNGSKICYRIENNAVLKILEELESV